MSDGFITGCLVINTVIIAAVSFALVFGMVKRHFSWPLFVVWSLTTLSIAVGLLLRAHLLP